MPILKGLRYSEYAAINAVNWSRLSQIDKSPLHYRAYQDRDSDSRLFGRALHCAVFEPAAFDERYAGYGKPRNPRHAEYKAFLGDNPGKEILSRRAYDEVALLSQGLRGHPWLARQMKTGEGEIAFTWLDDETGLKCKGRADWLTADGDLIDLKGWGTSDAYRAGSMAAKSLAHGQMAHYKQGLAANGVEVERVFIVSCETSLPYDVASFELEPGVPDGALHEGEILRKRLMSRLKHCLDVDHWPGRQEHGPEPLYLPEYARTDALEGLEFDEV